jgi:Ca-activated chloride channel family protein
VERLSREPGRNSVIVLATDGVNNAGVDPRQAADLAAASGIKIYTIGIGQRGGYDAALRGPFGMVQRVHYEEPDEGLLQAIAGETGGRYWRATDAGSLATVYQEISRLEKREVKVRARRDAEEHFYPFLLAGALLLGLGLLVRLRVRNTL